MDRMLTTQYKDKSRLNHSPSINRINTYSKGNDIDTGKNDSGKHLRHKLDNAFSDLESLRKALKDIKHKNENSTVQNTNPFSNNQPINSSIQRRNNFSPKRNNFDNNNINDVYDRNGGSNSRSNSNKKSVNFNNYRNPRSDMNDNLKTPKGRNYIYLLFILKKIKSKN